jgi:inner membrane protein
MDTLTHALSGALLARATASAGAPPRSLPRRIAAGFFACAAPDLDFVFSFFGPAAYVLNHRGVTHSLLLLPLWAWGVAWVLARILREPGGWRAFYGITAMALGAHIAGDLITSYGTMVLWPFSDWRAALGTTFIIDLWFSGIIVAGLAVSAWLFHSRIPSILFLVLLAGYVGFQFVQKQHAVRFGEEYAASRGLSAAKVTAQPRPVTPFNWTVFVSDESAHRFAHINLFRKDEKQYRPGDGFLAKIDAPYLPLERAIWVTRSRYGETQQPFNKEAWNSPPLGFFRWFAELPAYDWGSEGCAGFIDLRFDTPGRDYVPFRFGACREGNAWRGYERGLAGEKIPLP